MGSVRPGLAARLALGRQLAVGEQPAAAVVARPEAQARPALGVGPVPLGVLEGLRLLALDGGHRPPVRDDVFLAAQTTLPLAEDFVGRVHLLAGASAQIDVAELLADV